MNPFRYSEPVPAAELIDRDEETTLLVETAVSGNNSRIVAPRRYGKTSLLNRLGESVAGEGWNAVYVDFFGVLTLADVAARVERAYAAQLEGRVAAWFAGFRRRLRPSLRIGGDDAVGADLELSSIRPPSRRYSSGSRSRSGCSSGPGPAPSSSSTSSRTCSPPPTVPTP